MKMVKKPKQANNLLRHEREKRGWSQARLAEILGVDPSMISRWEGGERGLASEYQERLCNIFEKDAVELGFIEPLTSKVTSTTESDEEVNRRDASKKIASMILGGSAFLATSPDILQMPLWERLSSALEKPSRIDAVGLIGLEQITKDYWGLRAHIGYQSLLHGFSGHLKTIIHLLQASQSPTSRKRLCTIASKIAQHIGAIYFDMNNYSTAREYYTVSIETAKEAEDYTLWALGLVRMSSLPIYDKRPQEALPLLQAARQLVGPSGTPTIHAWIASMEAEAYANLHDNHACFQVLKQAEKLTERLQDEEDPHGIKFNYARFIGYRGVCHLHLQQPGEAISALNQGTSQQNTLSARQRSIILADSAAAYTQQGEVDEACRLSIQALTMVDQTKSLLVTQRIIDVRRAMVQWGNTQSMKELDSHLALRGILLS